MPPSPCETAPENLVHIDDATTPATNGTKPLTEDDSATAKSSSWSSFSPKNTFFWELNFYSFSALAFFYFSVQESSRIYFHIIFALIAVDAARYYHIRGSMSGVPYTPPFVSLFAMVIHPVRFWAEMADISMTQGDGMCCNTLMGKFVVFITDPQLCRQVFLGEGVYGMYAHPNAYWLFGPKNLIYLPKEMHKRFRAILSPALFGEEALLQYAQAQDRIITQFMGKYADECKATGKPMDARIAFRSMAAAASQESFMGPYLNAEQRVHLENDILTFTMGFLCFPFPYFNSGLHKAIQAKNRIETTIQAIVPKARKYVASGAAPRCMVEHWALSIQKAVEEQGLANHNELPCCNDDDMGRTLLDFLFAAQDATNSALAYAVDVLEANPDVIDKIRKEVEETLGKDSNKDVWSLVRDPEGLPYTSKVANQLLHHKPPVPMVPMLSKKPSVLNGFNIPTGALVIPSITYSSRVSGASLEFLPEREDADSLFVKTLTFGTGQHKCPGRRYAETLLRNFLVLVVPKYDFKRVGRRPSADEFIYFPTLFPTDNDFMVSERA